MVCSFFCPEAFGAGRPGRSGPLPGPRAAFLGGTSAAFWGSQESTSPQCRQGAAVVRVSQRRTKGRRGGESTPFSVTGRDQLESAPDGEPRSREELRSQRDRFGGQWKCGSD